MPERWPPAVPSISIVIPAYNEAKRLPSAIRSVASHLRAASFGRVEVLVIDDGSQDGTFATASEGGSEFAGTGARLRVLRNARNRGKGYSVRRGMRESKCDWILFSDADLSTPISELDLLLREALAGGHDVAIGSRAIDRSLIGVRQPLYREVGGRLFNLNVRLLTGLDIADTQCGFKLFRRKAARQIAARQRTDRFGFDVEQLYLARKMGFSIVEVPVRWDNAEESSVGLADGLKAFVDVWRVKWNDLVGRYAQEACQRSRSRDRSS